MPKTVFNQKIVAFRSAETYVQCSPAHRRAERVKPPRHLYLLMVTSKFSSRWAHAAPLAFLTDAAPARPHAWYCGSGGTSPSHKMHLRFVSFVVQNIPIQRHLSILLFCVSFPSPRVARPCECSPGRRGPCRPSHPHPQRPRRSHSVCKRTTLIGELLSTPTVYTFIPICRSCPAVN